MDILGFLLERASGSTACLAALVNCQRTWLRGLRSPCWCRKRGGGAISVVPHICIITPTLYLPNLESVANHTGPRKGQRLWPKRRDASGGNTCLVDMWTVYMSVWEKPTSRQAVLAFSSCIRADDLLRLAATLAHQPIGRERCGRFVYSFVV